jgi:mannose-1-phosphate guanylyltransferase
MGRNTAAAIGLAAWHLRAQDPEALMVILPADHAIADSTAFCESLQQAAATVLQTDMLMTLGVQPRYPATGYGYIEVGESLALSTAPRAARVTQFKEKPSAEVAAQFIASQRYVWNCGIFLWRAATIERELRTHMPVLAQQLDVYMAAVQAGATAEALHAAYQQLPSVPIDIGVLEKSSQVGVLPVTWDWSDVGSWRALAELHAPDAAGNVAVGPHLGQATSNTIVYSPNRLVVTIGISDVIIVQTDDAVLVCHKDHDQAVRDMVQLLQQRGDITYL